jgi:predicted ArsR family transcriptional regulator
MGEERINTGVRILKSAADKLDATSTRLGISRTAVIEQLIYLCADHLKPVSLELTPGRQGSRGRRGMGRRKKS